MSSYARPQTPKRGLREGDAALARPSEHMLLAMQRSAGNAATARLVQRVIYKDDDAKKQGRPYKNISKGPWYKGLKQPEQLIAIALHKRPEPLTVEEANVKIKAIVKGTDVLVDEDVGYESGADHDEDEGVLTVEQFTQLPEKGTLNPTRLRTAQPGIELHFQDVSKGTVAGLGQRLGVDPDIARQLPAVKIGIYKGRVYSFDTRRVVACQMGRARNSAVVISYEKISDKEKENRVSSVFGARPWMGLVTAVRNNGTKGGSKPHVNPAYADQLSKRVGANWNYNSHLGFPTDQPDISSEEESEEDLDVETDKLLASEKADVQPEKTGDTSGELPAEPTDDILTGLLGHQEPEKNSLKAEMLEAQSKTNAWLREAQNTPSTSDQIQHARKVYAYITKEIKLGHHASAPNGWMLEDALAIVTGLQRNAATQFLCEYRIPEDPGNSPQPLLPYRHGG